MGKANLGIATLIMAIPTTAAGIIIAMGKANLGIATSSASRPAGLEMG